MDPVAAPPPEIEALAAAIRAEGGQVLAVYQEPYKGHWQVFALLPLAKVRPTPFQRDLSEAHVERLKEVIAKLGRFLDPIVAVRAPDGGFWTPNGNHRREALLQLGRTHIPAVVVPDPAVAFEILALNTEKAHNLKEKALEVIRMYRALLAAEPTRKEKEFAFQFEEAYLATLGLLYEENERFPGSAYAPILRKVDLFLDLELPLALEERKRRAELLKEVDGLVEPLVQALRARGYTQPFLRHGLVSKVNPVKRKRIVTLSYEEVMRRMKAALSSLDPAKLKVEELAAAMEE
ncbi:MAG: ParB/RepB/Spo0J family partition protein [Candidatus Bipolaricaulota bacterium]|nr:ParB/RepB/Spo0J family partition protein [Candidatus Bipolaricaulota bacterium]MDW8152061.1 ParB/RepB/Spo0J family partition protein [Candidatus Bipolaricaulota bacterium]